MKTTDSVMREKLLNYCDVFDTANGAYLREGDIVNFISHSLAEARREWVEEMRGLKKPDNDCRHSPEDSCDSNCTYQNEHKIYNQAIDDVVDLLTGDNPEEAK